MTTATETNTNTKTNTNVYDFVVCTDTTGSMASTIQSVQLTLKTVAARLAEGGGDVRIAAIEYKDHCDRLVVGVTDFCSNVDTVKRTIDSWSANGGGDHPEAMADALHAASTALSWRENSTKLIVLCADAPPHGVGSGGDNHPNGCPCGHDPLQAARNLAERGAIIYTVGVGNPDNHTVSFLSTISHITGGRYLPLANAASLPTILVGGAEEEAALNAFAEEMERERDRVLTEAAARGAAISEEAMYGEVTSRLQSRGVRVAQPQMNACVGGGATWDAAVEDMGQATSLSSYQALQMKSSNQAALSSAPRAKGSAPAHSVCYGAPPSAGGFGGYGAMPTMAMACAAPMSAAPMSTPAMEEVSYNAMPIAHEQVKRALNRKR